MYSKEETQQIKRKFWIAFGQYMKLQKSSEGREINWVNYKTGIKNLYVKSDVDNKSARVFVEISEPDVDLRQLMYEQLEEFQVLFESILGQQWIWYSETIDFHGKKISKVELRLENVSIFRENDWPEIISFLKNNLILFDEFWENAKDAFDIFK